MSRSLAWLRRGALPRHRLTLRDLQGGLQGGGVRGGKLEGGVEDSVQGRVGSLLLCPPSRRLHLSRASGCIKSNVPDEEKEKSEVITQGYFDRREEERNKESFEGAVDIFTHKDSRRRGQVEFIYAAMRNMEKFGVHKDLASYKKLLEVFPKGKMIPENRLQADFFHYPKQQQCATSLLQKMESNKIIPDEETGDLLLNVFGKYSTPYKRYCRMMYWMPKFKNLSPWPLPEEMPREGLELARLAIRQITSVDPATRIEVIDTQDIPDSNDKVRFNSQLWDNLRTVFLFFCSSAKRTQRPFRRGWCLDRAAGRPPCWRGWPRARRSTWRAPSGSGSGTTR